MPQTAARRRRGRLRDRLGAQGTADPREPAPTSSTSPRSSSARARCRCRSRTRASRRLTTSPARRSATGASATSTRSSPRSPRPVSIRHPTSSSCSSSSTCSALLAGDIDAAEAMTYNEYAQVLEAVNPDTGELYTPEDFNVISYEDVGVGMLQDAIWADAAKLESDDAYRGHGGELPCRLDRRLGVLPRQPRVVPRHRRRRRLAARRQPPAVADERDQQAHLAGGRRHRHDRPGGVGSHGRDRPGHRQPGRCDGADRAARPTVRSPTTSSPRRWRSSRPRASTSPATASRRWRSPSKRAAPRPPAPKPPNCLRQTRRAAVLKQTVRGLGVVRHRRVLRRSRRGPRAARRR